MSIRLRQPKFFVALGGAAVAWPFEARGRRVISETKQPLGIAMIDHVAMG